MGVLGELGDLPKMQRRHWRPRHSSSVDVSAQGSPAHQPQAGIESESEMRGESSREELCVHFAPQPSVKPSGTSSSSISTAVSSPTKLMSPPALAPSGAQESGAAAVTGSGPGPGPGPSAGGGGLSARHAATRGAAAARLSASSTPDLLANNCPTCGAPIEEYDEETIALCIVCLSAFVQRAPILAAPLLLDMVQIVARYGSFTCSYFVLWILDRFL